MLATKPGGKAVGEAYLLGFGELGKRKRRRFWTGHEVHSLRMRCWLQSTLPPSTPLGPLPEAYAGPRLGRAAAAGWIVLSAEHRSPAVARLLGLHQAAGLVRHGAGAERLVPIGKALRELG